VQRHLKRRIQITSIVVSFVTSCLVFSSGAQTPARSGVDSIRAEELRQKVTYIASERFRGRGNGTPELNLAAEYIAGIFEKSGLKPAGDNNSYYQRFDIYSSRLGSNNELRFKGSADFNPDLKVRSDFIPELWSVSGSITAPLQLVEGNGPISSSVRGRIAVEVEDQIVTDDPEFPATASEARKLQELGAVAAIIIES